MHLTPNELDIEVSHSSFLHFCRIQDIHSHITVIDLKTFKFGKVVPLNAFKY